MADLDTQARQRAARVTQGEAIRSLLTSPRVRRTLARAAEDGEVALAAVAPELAATFPDAMRDLQARQLVGLLVRQVLEEAGFVVANPRRRFPGVPPFRFGATFARPPEPGAPGLVERIVASLDDAEAATAHRLLSRRLGLA